MSVSQSLATGALLLFAFTVGVVGCRDLPTDPFGRVDAGGAAGVGGDIRCPTEMVGFATQEGAATGGGTVAPTVVKTLAELVASAGQPDPAVILLEGTILVPAADQPLQVPVESNKSIIGAGAQSGLIGAGLIINGKENVIVQNLVIALAAGTDAIRIQASRRVWIDHCDLSSDRDHSSAYYGGLVNITHACDFVTVSWTRFHDHFNTSLVGHSDSATAAAEDTGHLTITYHHNLFLRTASWQPRARFGRLHVFNNHYQDVSDFAIASQMYAQVIVERNVFDRVALPITNQHERSATSFPGQVLDVENLYGPASGTNTVVPPTGAIFTFSPPYQYMTDSTDTVPVIVEACVGPGKV